MNKHLSKIILLSSLFLFSGVVSAETTAECEGVALLIIGQDGPDRRMAVYAGFTMEMRDDKTASWKLENEFAKPLTGTGKETDNEDMPWYLQGKDANGGSFTGNLTILDPAYSSDEYLYVILELKNKQMMITAPMSCELE